MTMSTPSIEHKISGWSGEQLRAARLRMGLTTEQVERQLFFQPGYVDSIEQGNFKQLPSTLFVKGYIRAYAKLLQLSPHPFIQELQERAEDHGPGPEREPKAAFTSTAFANAAFPDTVFPNNRVWNQKPAQGKQSIGWRFWLLLLVIAMLLLAMWWPQLTPTFNQWLSPLNLRLPVVSVVQMMGLGDGNTWSEPSAVDGADAGALNQSPNTQQSQLETGVPADEIPAFMAGPTANVNISAMPTVDVKTGQPLASADAAVFPVDASPADPVNALPAKSALPTENSFPTEARRAVVVKALGDGRWQIGATKGAAGQGAVDRLHIEFKSSTWLQISDAVGVSQPLKYHMPNAELNLTGEAPFTLTTGDSKALRLRFNEQEVNL